MLSTLFGIIMMVCILSSSTQAQIFSIKVMKEVQAKVEQVLKVHKPEDVWVAFDIDMTLIQSEHPATYYPVLKKYKDVYKRILGKLSPLQIDLMHTLLVLTTPQKLVEADTPHRIKNLQKKGVGTIAFTAVLTGKLPGYKNKVLVLRKDHLQKIGLDFAKKRTQFPPCVPFMDFPHYGGYFPLLYNGILSSNGERNVTKGETFVAFLKHMGPSHLIKVGKCRYPKVVILVDDRKKNLEDVGRSLKAYDSSIQFIGLEYQAAYDYAPTDISKEDFQKFWEGLAEKAKAVNF
ncbi:MAG: DUF2608 domain-containing protein [Alphaproteobacteria bacterium]|nr:DUF2608 domain-containing protein [Alphaproteobacteria bacterium]